jgi:hypothetical protein
MAKVLAALALLVGYGSANSIPASTSTSTTTQAKESPSVVSSRPALSRRMARPRRCPVIHFF